MTLARSSHIDIRSALRIVGFGAIADDISTAIGMSSFSIDPMVVIKQFWAQVQGRSWDQAFSSANARATSKNWVASDNPSKQDFITLMVSTAANARIASEKNIAASPTDNPADTLARTLYVIAKRRGINTPTPADVTQMKNNSTGNIEVLVPVMIVAVLAQLVAVMVIAVALIYFASVIIDDLLSKVECDRELVRLHAAYNKIVDYHIQNPNAPWTPADTKARDDLIEAQKFVAGGCTVPKPPPAGPFDIPWGWFAVGATAVSAGVIGFIYRDDIKHWLASRRSR